MMFAIDRPVFPAAFVRTGRRGLPVDTRGYLPERFLIDSPAAAAARLGSYEQRTREAENKASADTSTVLRLASSSLDVLDRQAIIDKLRALDGLVAVLQNSHSGIQPLAREGSSLRQVSVLSSQPAVLTAASTAASGGHQHAVSVLGVASAERIKSDPQTNIAAPLGVAGDFQLGQHTVSVSAGQSLLDLERLINYGEDADRDGALDEGEDADADGVLGGGTAQHGVIAAIDTDGALHLQAGSPGKAGLRIRDSDLVLEQVGFFQTTLAGNRIIKHPVQPGADARLLFDGKEVAAPTNTIVDHPALPQGLQLAVRDTSQKPVTLTILPSPERAATAIGRLVSLYNQASSAVSAEQATGGRFRYDAPVTNMRYDLIGAATPSAAGSSAPAPEEIGLYRAQKGLTPADKARQTFLDPNTLWARPERSLPVPLTSKRLEDLGIYTSNDGTLIIDTQTLADRLRQASAAVKETLAGPEGFAGRVTSVLDRAISDSGTMDRLAESLGSALATIDSPSRRAGSGSLLEAYLSQQGVTSAGLLVDELFV
ncbi:MAG: flagellar filament capping protein FliD [Candidatus Schekmanbacteria bacterium]|nr:flagellar filament capping protein FliD [Candidatus Schekmanbacteria bacterium]